MDKTGLWLFLTIILIYSILLCLRYRLIYLENKNLSKLEELSDKELKFLLKDYFEKNNWQFCREKKNDLIFEKEKVRMIVRYSKYLSLVSVSQIKEFKRSLSHSNFTEAYFVTISDFNSNCLKEKESIGLINGKRLLRMIDKKVLMEKKEKYGSREKIQ